MAANLQEFVIEFKLEFTKNLQTEFKFFILNFVSSTSSSAIFTKFMLSSKNFYRVQAEFKKFLLGLG